MAFEVRHLSSDMRLQWDRLVEDSNGGTIFHRLDFLDYHGKRFKANEHHLCIYKGQTLYGVMPMALFEKNGLFVARSPYGGSYGGPVFKEPQRYDDSHRIIELILRFLTSKGVKELILTLPISICYRRYSETFRLVLMEGGFQCVNRDISSVVCLSQKKSIREMVNARSRRMARKALKSRVEVGRRAPLSDFWYVMEKTFARLGIEPTHTLVEFQWLHEHFPERIYADVAYLKGTPVAGIGYVVINERVNNSFYLCQDPQKQQFQALSLLICEALEQSRQEGFTWFDFGTSSAKMKGRANLFEFKENFGTVGIFRETYVWRQPG
jgi:hypothetical protein